jgi:hypothetical protein
VSSLRTVVDWLCIGALSSFAAAAIALAFEQETWHGWLYGLAGCLLAWMAYRMARSALGNGQLGGVKSEWLRALHAADPRVRAVMRRREQRYDRQDFAILVGMVAVLGAVILLPLLLSA